MSFGVSSRSGSFVFWSCTWDFVCILGVVSEISDQCIFVLSLFPQIPATILRILNSFISFRWICMVILSWNSWSDGPAVVVGVTILFKVSISCVSSCICLSGFLLRYPNLMDRFLTCLISFNLYRSHLIIESIWPLNASKLSVSLVKCVDSYLKWKSRQLFKCNRQDKVLIDRPSLVSAQICYVYIRGNVFVVRVFVRRVLNVL